jgi:hypothetical protein
VVVVLMLAAPAAAALLLLLQHVAEAPVLDAAAAPAAAAATPDATAPAPRPRRCPAPAPRRPWRDLQRRRVGCLHRRNDTTSLPSGMQFFLVCFFGSGVACDEEKNKAPHASGFTGSASL